MIKMQHVIDLYKKVINICMSDGFLIEIDGKRYRKDEISYDYLIENASHIGYIEDTNTENSRVYASNTVMLMVTISLDRRCSNEKETGVVFYPVHDGVVNLMYRTVLWNLNSGYNSALNDTKSIIDKLRSNSDNLSRGI